MPTQKTIDTLNLFANQLADLAVETRRIASCLETDPRLNATLRLEQVLALEAHADGLDRAAHRLQVQAHQRSLRNAPETLLPGF